MSGETLFREIIADEHRANPYPLYARLRETPVSRQEDGTYVVSSYAAISALLADPRISADEGRNAVATGTPSMRDLAPWDPSFLVQDPPRHDQLRNLTMKFFGPPCDAGRVEAMRPRITQIVTALLDAQQGNGQFDIVDTLAYPLPVTVICELLGVPPEDEPRFRGWSDTLANTLDPDPSLITPDYMQQVGQAIYQIREYMGELIAAHRKHPGDDLLSAMATDHEPGAPMAEQDLISTAVLLLIAGHETTVNLIANGMLTLLRYPDVLDRLRQDPHLIVPTVEELLRYEPPVQFRPRTALADIAIAGTVIPAGAPLMLLLAAGNRDPRRFADPDRFIPEREDNQHFGFGGGIHYCFGAPLARVETQVALTEMVRRLVSPRLVVDPPPYRSNPALRGPRHLEVACEGLVD